MLNTELVACWDHLRAGLCPSGKKALQYGILNVRQDGAIQLWAFFTSCVLHSHVLFLFFFADCAVPARACTAEYAGTL